MIDADRGSGPSAPPFSELGSPAGAGVGPRRARPIIVRVGIVVGLAMLLALGASPTARGRQTVPAGPATAEAHPACAPPPVATPGADPVEGEVDVGVEDDGDAAPTEEETALINAAGRGEADEVDRLLAGGARVDARDATGRTALIAAAWGNHLGAACRLIEAGANVSLQDDTQQSAYLIATSEGYLDLLRATLAAGADVRDLDSFRGTGLIRAAERGHGEVVAELLRTDIAVDHVNRLGLTALLEAIVFGDGGPRHTEVVQLLIGAGADPNLADGAGVSPLAHARQLGFAEIAAILEGAGGR